MALGHCRVVVHIDCLTENNAFDEIDRMLVNKTIVSHRNLVLLMYRDCIIFSSVEVVKQHGIVHELGGVRTVEKSSHVVMVVRMEEIDVVAVAHLIVDKLEHGINVQLSVLGI